jgi:hypothetical protein
VNEEAVMETEEKPKRSVVDLFHDHLDECEQCREHPFDLCPEGQKRMANVGGK